MNYIRRGIFLVSLAYLAVFTTVSQIDAEVQHNFQISCLKSASCGANNSNCTIKRSDRFQINLDSLPDTKNKMPFFVAECVGHSDGTICTTGNADDTVDLDWKGLDKLKTDNHYVFTGLFDNKNNPIDQSVKLIDDKKLGPLEWQSNLDGGYPRFFIALYESTNKYVAGNKSVCSINFEAPLGRVFDSKTLEPVVGAKINLFQKIGESFLPADNPGLSKEYTTDVNGAINIHLPEGTFRLEAEHPAYEKTRKIENNKNTLKMYPDLVSSSSAVIVQTKDAIAAADIALDPKPGTLGYTGVNLSAFIEFIDKDTGNLSIVGTVSHPSSFIQPYTTNNLDAIKIKSLDGVQADKNGVFTLTIKQADFGNAERLGGVNIKKSDLLTNDPESMASESADINIEPILRSVSGYAYDNKGTPIPAAAVSIRLPFAKSSLYETTADLTGYFQIPKEYTPIIPFILDYKSGGASSEATISTFLKQNAAYIKSTSLNQEFYSNTKDTLPVDKTVTENKNTINYLSLRPVDKHPYAFWSVVATVFILGMASIIAGSSLIKKSHKHL